MPTKRVKNQIQLFRAKVAISMSQYVERMKIFIAEEKLTGASMAEIQKMRKDPGSSWNKEKKGLNNAIKREVAGLINEIHHIAYLEPLK